MSDEDALLAAILADPDDDTPRLVYADWLDEHGRHDRAEFIRLQCPTGPAADDPSAEDRAAELEERNRGRWLAGLPAFADAHWEFRRGFPEILTAPIELLLERYEAFARVPWTRGLCLHDVLDAPLRDFVARPWNPRWVELELAEGGPDPDADYLNPAAEALARSPQVRQLRTLHFTAYHLALFALQALALSPHLDGLRELRIEGNTHPPFLVPLRNRFGDRLVVG
ncbi:MAG: hypothetical protein C0501_31765 [Isosphaera sp.]|nr:hypothetical protein [Isosphaera sp.]